MTFAPVSHRRRAVLPRWVIHLGMPGLFLAALLDSSIIPLPIPGTTDLLLLWLVSHRGNPFVLTAIAVAGSVLGGYSTWRVGKKGGEKALERWVPKKYLQRIVGWVKRNPSLAVFLPGILPPPVPLLPFLLASGALGVPQKPFLASFSAARTLRYSLVAWLAVRYGRHIIRLWTVTLAKWSTPILWTFGVVTVAGICWGIVKLRSGAGQRAARDGAAEARATSGD
jgi:membrane protein YqaA with SNARE-associated domain